MDNKDNNGIVKLNLSPPVQPPSCPPVVEPWFIKVSTGVLVGLALWLVNQAVNIERRLDKVESAHATYIDGGGDLRRDSSLGELFSRMDRLENEIRTIDGHLLEILRYVRTAQ